MRAAPALLLLALGLTQAGCAESSRPEVEIVAATPGELAAGSDDTDDLTLLVRYADADGDLGSGFARVIDCRAQGVETQLDLPAIANEQAVAAGVAIEGELELRVNDVGMVRTGQPPPECEDEDAEAGAFCVVLVDQVGNESVPACTEALLIRD